MYIQVNNRKSYDLKQESNSITYILNSYGMAEFLPTSGFKWINPKNFH